MLAPDQARATTRAHGKTFALAARLLPSEVRDDVYRLYAVFRALDDLVDGGAHDAEARLAAVEDWARGSAAVGPEATVLADVDARHALPRDALDDFCAGMRDDLAGLDPQTEADVDRYCYRVAGTVGLTLAAVLGTDGSGQAREAAIALGMAMQRTNILRDVDEDRRAGRCYIAAEAVATYGAALPGVRAALMRDQIARADALYDEGLAGVRRLRRGRMAIRAAAAMYREILRQIERDGFTAGRAVVPTSRKLAVALTSSVMS